MKEYILSFSIVIVEKYYIKNCKMIYIFTMTQRNKSYIENIVHNLSIIFHIFLILINIFYIDLIINVSIL